jgi:hypothetical protein
MKTFISTLRRLNLTCGIVRSIGIAAIGFSILVADTAQAGIIESIEAPGVTHSSVKNTEVVNFNGLPTGNTSFDQFTFLNLTVSYSGSFFVLPPGQYGGAQDPNATAKDTNYLGVQSGEKVTMTLSAPQAYFGLWYSAADKLNDLAFYNGDKLLASITGTGPVLNSLPTSYNGNPTSEFKGQNAREKYVFINFSAKSSSDMFDKIVLSNAKGGTIFESDNHTFSADVQTAVPGTTVVPELPSVSLLGLGAICLAINAYRLRRQRRHDCSVV